MDPKHVEKIIKDHHKGNQTGLISLLEEIQAKYSYLPEEALRMVAQRRGVLWLTFTESRHSIEPSA
jgi:NADH:ubiquinone oxidoreductase subunit E